MSDVCSLGGFCGFDVDIFSVKTLGLAVVFKFV